MSKYRRPWWLLVNKQAGLTTTIQEESDLNERVFTIRGTPMIRGLAWLIWGPAGALLVITILTGLAIGLNVREQSGITRMLFVAALLGLPGLAWAGGTIIVNRLTAKHLQTECELEAQTCVIRLDQQQGRLFYKTPGSSTEKQVAYQHIHKVDVTPAIGSRDGKSMRFILETNQGTVILLNEVLGTETQKVDLAHEIKVLLQKYSHK